jgi:ribosomal protein L2
MTMLYGGHKQRYRIIDFKRTKEGISIVYNQLNTIQIVLHLRVLMLMVRKRYCLKTD